MKKFTLRNSEKLVGIFVLIGTLFLLGSVAFVGINKRWFQSDLEYRCHFVTAEGLSPGLNLQLHGFTIGRVKNLNLQSDSKVEAVLTVFNEYQDRMVENSVIHLAVSPLGFGSSLVLYPGKDANPILAVGSTIPTTDMDSGRALLAEGKVLRPKRRDEVSGLLETLPPLMGQVSDFVGTLDNLVARLDSRLMGSENQAQQGLLGTVGGTLEGVDSTTRQFGHVAVRLDSMAVQLNLVMKSMAQFMTHLEDPNGLVPTLLGDQGSAAQLFNDENQLFNRLNDITTDLQTLTAFLNASTPEISVLMEETTAALLESKKVMQGLSNNPLLRGGISDEAQATSLYEGYRQEVR